MGKIKKKQKRRELTIYENLCWLNDLLDKVDEAVGNSYEAFDGDPLEVENNSTNTVLAQQTKHGVTDYHILYIEEQLDFVVDAIKGYKQHKKEGVLDDEGFHKEVKKSANNNR